MTQANARSFIDALHRLEGEGDAEPIASLFAERASIANPVVEHRGEGPQGALDFWRSYRQAFGDVRSEFSHVLEADGSAMLEWTSTGHAAGHEVRYSGVSVLEFGEGGITAFRTYFDPAQLGHQMMAGDRSAH